MNTRAKAALSVIIALVFLGGIIYVNRRGDEGGNVASTQPTSGEAMTEGHQDPASIPVATSTNPQVTLRGFTLMQNKSAIVDGYTFTLKNIEDSRCPEGVQCIRAGEAKAYVLVEFGSNKKDISLTSDGEWVSVGGRQVRITKVLPVHRVDTPPTAYTVTFEARR